MDGIETVTLCGKIMRRTGSRCMVYDSFCGIEVYTKDEKIQQDIDRSIRENYIVQVTCTVLSIAKRVYIKVVSVHRASFEQEMYKTMESMAYWERVLLPK